MSENSTLKMRFKLNELEFELEGNQEVVKKEFEDFKSFITEDLLPKMNSIVYNGKATEQPEILPQLSEVKQVGSNEYQDIPSLKEIAIKGLPKSEPDWLLVYCYFASNFGTDTFSKENLKNYYEQTGRKNENRYSNFSNNIKSLVSKDYIGVHNDNEFFIKEKGIIYVKNILSDKPESINNKKVSRVITKNLKDLQDRKKSASKNGSTSSRSNLLDRSLNLRPEGKESLQEFLNKYNCDSNPKYITVIVYYLKEILNIEKINLKSIYTALDELNVRIPTSLKTIVNNTKNRNGWLEYDSLDDILLSIKGSNAVKFDLIQK